MLIECNCKYRGKLVGCQSECQPPAASAGYGQWQPIDSVPKDTRVLLWSGKEMFVGHWAKNTETDDEAFIIAVFGDDGEDQLLVKATHWMPLPERP